MAGAKQYKPQKYSGATIDLGELNPKQKLFCQARTRYVAYGGARGGEVIEEDIPFPTEIYEEPVLLSMGGNPNPPEPEPED